MNVEVERNEKSTKPISLCQLARHDFHEELSTPVDWQSFYRLEESFLKDLEQLNKQGAQEKVQRLLEFVEVQEGETFCVKNYLILLSGMVTRRLARERLSSSKAFSFNVICDSIVETKLTEGNTERIADELIEFYMYALREKEPVQLQHDTVNEVIEYIDDSLLSFLSVEGIAERFNVSTSHLSRIFREHTGVTLVEYINIRKVEEAQYYLRFSTKKISEISDDFHFCNQSYFTRIFKKYTGETPRKFRNSLERNFFEYELTPKQV